MEAIHGSVEQLKLIGTFVRKKLVVKILSSSYIPIKEI